MRSVVFLAAFRRLAIIIMHKYGNALVCPSICPCIILCYIIYPGSIHVGYVYVDVCTFARVRRRAPGDIYGVWPFVCVSSFPLQTLAAFIYRPAGSRVRMLG